MYRYKEPSARKIIKRKNNSDKIRETHKIHKTKIQKTKQQKICHNDNKNAEKLTTLIKNSDKYHINQIKIPVMALAFVNQYCFSTYTEIYISCGICSDLTRTTVCYFLKEDSLHVCDACHGKIMNKKSTIKSHILKSFFYIKHIFKKLYLQDLYPTVLSYYFINIYQTNFNQLSYFPFVHKYRNYDVEVNYDNYDNALWRRLRVIPFLTQWHER